MRAVKNGLLRGSLTSDTPLHPGRSLRLFGRLKGVPRFSCVTVVAAVVAGSAEIEPEALLARVNLLDNQFVAQVAAEKRKHAERQRDKKYKQTVGQRDT